jgi:hypothetical protein
MRNHLRQMADKANSRTSEEDPNRYNLHMYIHDNDRSRKTNPVPKRINRRGDPRAALGHNKALTDPFVFLRGRLIIKIIKTLMLKVMFPLILLISF